MNPINLFEYEALAQTRLAPTVWDFFQEGVYHVLELLRAELARAMALAGRPTLASIDRSLLKIA